LGKKIVYTLYKELLYSNNDQLFSQMEQNSMKMSTMGRTGERTGQNKGAD
jgi:hypothetical protein